mmetsp:Transcript_118009/g.330445  ORF Transcript_118009/g.330445 Transcript_118009/m.330445 type:complete len:377 (+) Transcript_118009:647-1777(+)
MLNPVVSGLPRHCVVVPFGRSQRTIKPSVYPLKRCVVVPWQNAREQHGEGIFRRNVTRAEPSADRARISMGGNGMPSTALTTMARWPVATEPCWIAMPAGSFAVLKMTTGSSRSPEVLPYDQTWTWQPPSMWTAAAIQQPSSETATKPAFEVSCDSPTSCVRVLLRCQLKSFPSTSLLSSSCGPLVLDNIAHDDREGTCGTESTAMLSRSGSSCSFPFGQMINTFCIFGGPVSCSNVSKHTTTRVPSSGFTEMCLMTDVAVICFNFFINTILFCSTLYAPMLVSVLKMILSFCRFANCALCTFSCRSSTPMSIVGKSDTSSNICRMRFVASSLPLAPGTIEMVRMRLIGVTPLTSGISRPALLHNNIRITNGGTVM